MDILFVIVGSQETWQPFQRSRISLPYHLFIKGEGGGNVSIFPLDFVRTHKSSSVHVYGHWRLTRWVMAHICIALGSSHTMFNWILGWLFIVSNWISYRSAFWFPGLIEVWIILLEQLTAAVSNCPRQHQPPTLDLLFELLRDVTKTPGKYFYVRLLEEWLYI